MGDLTRQADAPTTRSLGSAGLLVATSAGVGVTWALGRLYLAVVVVAVGAQILFSVAGAAASPPSDLFHPALFTPTMDFSMLLALDALIALVGSVWFWRRASR